MLRRHIGTLPFVLLALASHAVMAAPVFVVSSATLAPNTANQPVDIYETGADSVEGMYLNLQVGDGGPLAGGSTSGPMIQNLTVSPTGGLFSTANSNISYQPFNSSNGNTAPPAQLWNANVTVKSSVGTVTADTQTLVAVAYIDTTGFNGSAGANSFQLIVMNTNNDSSYFINSAGNSEATGAQEGTLTISPASTPEPSSAALVAGAAAIGLLLRRAKR